ncbi:cell division protein FtsA [Candidatus Babeliales bacterium]|nr:cell division protein FtsA [Candidatus Babeliales bacterium]
MAKVILNNYWSAVDIGTTKICALIARYNSNGGIEVIGIGRYPSFGLKKGVVVDITTTVESIKKAIKEAEKMAGVKIESTAVGISGGHIQSFNSSGIVAIKNRDVSQGDIDRVIEAATAIPMPSDREILHILPQYFKVDGQEVVKDSIGMHGVRLESQVHIITGNISSASNIIKCCELAGVSVEDIVLEQLASADAVLTESERELGVGILDIGGGTSDFAIYKDGRIRHSKVLPIAGNHFTNDLAVCLRIPLEKAEMIKKKYGSVLKETGLGKKISVDLEIDNGVAEVETDYMFEILESRAKEVFDLILDDIIKFKLQPFMPYGIVLTGGGALLSGIVDVGKEVFGMPVRVGLPREAKKSELDSSVPDSLKSPMYSTGYGLLVYSAKDKEVVLSEGSQDPLFSWVFKRMKSWIYDFL